MTPLVQIDLVVLEAHELGDAQSRGIQHLEHGAVAMAQRIGDDRRLEQGIDLGLGEGLRKRAADFRHRDLRRRIDRDQTLRAP